MGAMRSLTRSQLVVYGAVAVALLLVGARWIRSADEREAGAGGVSFSPTSEGSAEGGGSLAVDAQGGVDVVVDVTGAVSRPGVYRLPSGSRVTDAVERAGGPGPRAELQGINLAARLTDGQQVVVPEKARGAMSASAPGASPESGPISVGTATVEQLDTIEGIGPVTAQKILDFRTQHGGVSSVDQLDQISGIGPATMESLRARLQP
jgi:competence protein ComEA